MTELEAPTTMILAAGRGTRLAPLTDHTPKPMLPVQGKPLIQWQVEALAHSGVRDIVINLYHLPQQIREHLGDGHRFNVSIRYSEEHELLETGGGIVNALPLLGERPFWLLNGDIWTDFDFASLPRTLTPDCPVHMVLTPTPSWRDQGDFEFANGAITRRGASYVYCGIALVSPEIFAHRPVRAFSWNEIFFQLIAEGRVTAQIHQGIWHDIGTLAQYRAITA